MLQAWFSRAKSQEYVFPLLLAYRWLSLLPPAFALAFYPAASALPAIVLAAAAAESLLLTFVHPRLNQLVLRQPAFLGVDLTVAAAFVALTGGTHSPYYLFMLSPILAASFFFQMRGGLVSAAAGSVLYLLALGAAGVVDQGSLDGLNAATAIISFFLIAIVFGYPSILLKRLQAATLELKKTHAELLQKNASLERSNREKQSVNDLAVAMQSSSIDVFDVQERILTTITGELEFERAMLGLVDPEANVIMGWLTHRRRSWYESPEGLFHTSEIPLATESGLVAQTVLEGKPRYVGDGSSPTTDPDLNTSLNMAPYAVLPLIMRDHAVGVLLVDNADTRAPIMPESLQSLMTVANQAAIALGSTKLCIERAQRLAIEEERNRIAMEIHDTASQSLFGIAYTLDACIKLLPGDPESVKARLMDTRAAAQRTMSDLRRSVYDIWAGEMNSAEFASQLRSHLIRLNPPETLRVDIQVNDGLDSLPVLVRKNLLRMAEEGLSNVVKHSAASQARVCLNAEDGHTLLTIEDNGRGFDASSAVNSGFGLKSVSERAKASGCQVRLESRVGEGTRLEVSVDSRVSVAPR